MGRTEALIALLDELLVAGAIIVLLVLLAWGTGALSQTLALILIGATGAVLAAVGIKAAQAQLKAPEAGPEALIGKTATVVDPLEPEGMVIIEGEYWKAVTKGEHIPRGSRVRVVGVEGNTLLVEPLPAQEG